MKLFESLVGNIGLGINKDLVKTVQWVLEQGWAPKSFVNDEGAFRYEFDAKKTKYKYNDAYNETMGFLQTIAKRVYTDYRVIDTETQVIIFDSKSLPFTVELIGTYTSKPSLTIVTYDDKSRIYLDKVFEKVK